MTRPYSPFRDGPWRHLSDRDVWHSLGVSALAVLLSGGLLWLFYFGLTLSLAARAGLRPRRAQTLLLFGKRLDEGRIDADFAARIARVHALLQEDPQRPALLLGGHTGAGLSEAAAALARLQQLGLPAGASLKCEDTSTDTLENLRNARELLAGMDCHVALVSNRYHLPRCLLLARSLGFEAEAVAAEARLSWRPGVLGRIALEASYFLWFDVGRRWARLIGNRRMYGRVS
ncbi:YdcF family protein [Tahibacter harae]|uniref:YdcF family protein n=1 Tax=Tahibacter harae TaxID=2963937 RepID=A0ABT1QPP7_9GAMM|nr:YdcF family protein [Tahibacter harae]MCQ4164268.1 YdcF family protein [Tahibacter harae]